MNENHDFCLKAFVTAFATWGLTAMLVCLVKPARAYDQTASSSVLTSPPNSQTVDFGNTHYAIPNIYDAGITPYRAKGYKEGTGYAAFTLNLILPNLLPRDAAQALQPELGWGSRFHALFEYGMDLRERQEVVSQILGWGKLSANDYTLEKNGCRLFKGNMTVTHELHVCYLPDRFFEYQCKTKKEVPSPSCEVHERINQDTTVIYDYSRDYSDDAVMIDNQVRALINSFIQSDTKYKR